MSLFSVDLTPDEAHNISVLLKRLQWDHIRQCAGSDDEAYELRDAVDAMQRELRVNGHDAR